MAFQSLLSRTPPLINALLAFKPSKPRPTSPNSTKAATRPYQGLSLDFCFSVMSSKDKELHSDFVGINGETSWILITDHFRGDQA